MFTQTVKSLENLQAVLADKVVTHIRRLSEEGHNMVCWSSGGAEYAREVASELGIADCFSHFLAKPQLMIDDQEPSEWKYLRVLHPNQIDGT